MKKIKWFEPKIGNISKKILNSTIKNSFISEGHVTTLVEKKISNLMRVRNVIMTSSGTSAIYLALRSLKISKKTDEVIVPNITYVATLNAIKLAGAKPVIVDVDFENSLISLVDLKKKINKNTKAIIFVHISGRSGNFKKILALAKKKKIKLIEDAAEAFGSKLDKRNLGTLGDLGCFSFTPTKIITSAQGGAVVTKNKKLANTIRSLKDQGRTKKYIGGDDVHDLFGGNYKFNDILASLLIPQLKDFNKKLKKANDINNFYRKNLKGVKQINFYSKKKSEVCIWTEIVCKRRDDLFKFLLKNNINCRKIWRPLSSFKHVKNNYKMSESYSISKKVLWLPSSLNLSLKDLKKICSKIKTFYRLKS